MSINRLNTNPLPRARIRQYYYGDLQGRVAGKSDLGEVLLVEYNYLYGSVDLLSWAAALWPDDGAQGGCKETRVLARAAR